VLATVDPTRLRHRAVPDWLAGMLAQDVLVEPGDGDPVLWDLAQAPVPVTRAELAEARAGVRSARHRLVVAEPPDGPVDLAEAAVAALADDDPDPRPLDATARSDLPADLHRRVLDLADAEQAAATALQKELR
jgi:hypothetical protein